MNSSLVNSLVLCALISSGSNPSCVAPPADSGAGQSLLFKDVAQSEKSQQRHPFQANNRIEVVAPTHKLRLAQENDISLVIHAAGITKVETYQLRHMPDEPSKVPARLSGGEGYASLPLYYHRDGSAYIRVIPRRLGSLRLRVRAFFPDGGYATGETDLNVGLPDRSPQKIIVGELGIPGSEIPIVFAYLDPQRGRNALTVSAVFENTTGQIQIDPAYASFRVRTANDVSIVRIIKSTGYIEPLQAGEGLVETRFGGWKNLTCILVEKTLNLNEGPTSDCKSLLLPGEKLGTPVRVDGSQ